MKKLIITIIVGYLFTLSYAVAMDMVGDLNVQGGDLGVGVSATEPGDVVLHDAGTIIMHDDGNDSSVTIGPVANGTTTLGITGGLDVSGGIDTGTLSLGSGSITDSSGAISFGDENVSTTGNISAATAKLSGLTDGYIPKHTADATGLEDSSLSDSSGNITQADSKYIATDEIRARDSGGLKLYDDSGAAGLVVEDGGNVGIGDTSPDAKLDVESGNIYLGNGNVKFETSGTGIDFSATSAAAGMTSELLDDYEEGTWTPTYVALTTNFDSITYDASRVGQYTKIGNTVIVSGYIITDSITVGSASGDVVISGLPFTSGGVSAVAFGRCANFNGDTPNNGYIISTETQIRPQYRTTSNGADTALQAADLGTGANANALRFYAVYPAS